MLGSGAQDGTRPHFMTLASLRPSFTDDYRHFLRWRDVVALLKREIAVQIPHDFEIAV
jgi:hypothetical protein